MTQSTEQLVRAFKARGGKVTFIPFRTAGEVKYKSLFKRSRAYSRKRREIFQARLATTAHGREKPGERFYNGYNSRNYAAVDVFMRFRNERGI